MTKRWKLVAGALLLALTLAACSGDDNGGGNTGGDTGGTTTGTTATSGTTGSAGSVSAADYAKSVCTSMSTYVNDVTNLSNNFSSSLDPSADLAGQRDAVVGFLDDILSATDKLITDLEGAGVPDVDNGQQIVDTIKQSFSQAKSVIEDAKSQVQGLSLDDPTAFASQLTNIGTAIQDSMTGIGTSLSALSSPELEAAVQSEPACSSLQSGGGLSARAAPRRRSSHGSDGYEPGSPSRARVVAASLRARPGGVGSGRILGGQPHMGVHWLRLER